MSSEKIAEIARTKALSRAIEVRKYFQNLKLTPEDPRRVIYQQIMGSIELIIDFLAD